jgi:hypothetical protein
MHDSGYLKAAFVYFHTSISQMFGSDTAAADG